MQCWTNALTTHYYSRLFATICTILCIRDYSLVTIRVFQTPGLSIILYRSTFSSQFVNFSELAFNKNYLTSDLPSRQNGGQNIDKAYHLLPASFLYSGLASNTIREISSIFRCFLASTSDCRILFPSFFRVYGKAKSGIRNRNSNRGKLENTESSSAVKYFKIASHLLSAFETIRTFSNWETDLKKVSETFTFFRQQSKALTAGRATDRSLWTSAPGDWLYRKNN